MNAKRLINACALIALGFALGGCVVVPHGYGYGHRHYDDRDHDRDRDRNHDRDRDRNHYDGPR